jgi:AcrR family transcriptional regulator
MTASDPATTPRPMRADARRNHEKLLVAAREAFAENPAASLEDVARRAGVGIGTLYRHFPTRRDLLEAAYLEEVEAMAREAAGLSDLEPWDALVAWMHRYLRFSLAKRAIGAELLAYISGDDDFFRGARTALTAVGDPLVARAQAVGAIRPDIAFVDIGRMASGIAGISADAAKVERILDLALDGLRYRPGA